MWTWGSPGTHLRKGRVGAVALGEEEQWHIGKIPQRGGLRDRVGDSGDGGTAAHVSPNEGIWKRSLETYCLLMRLENLKGIWRQIAQAAKQCWSKGNGLLNTNLRARCGVPPLEPSSAPEPQTVPTLAIGLGCSQELVDKTVSLKPEYPMDARYGGVSWNWAGSFLPALK